MEYSIQDLADYLPPVLSYSCISVPLTSLHPSEDLPKNTATILRRDLFDARFQILNEDDDSDDEGSAYGQPVPRHHTPPKGLCFNKDDSDLIKGVYEGGLKTWEASLDLVDCLQQQGFSDNGKTIQGQRLLEIGCGTALPTIYLLEQLFKGLLGQTPEETCEKTVVHLQDYNPEVLLYITFCNVVLAYWNARQALSSTPADDAASSTASLPSSRVRKLTEQNGDKLPASPTKLGKASAKSQDVRYTVEHDSETEINEVPLTDELIESFVDFLEKHNVELKFFSGAWQNFPTPDQPYDVILTSETVYELDNLEYLTSLLERAAAGHLSGKHDQLTLVACKRVYFGVGGGEIAFKHSVEKKRADVENIWNSGSGVERTVMKVNWAH